MALCRHVSCLPPVVVLLTSGCFGTYEPSAAETDLTTQESSTSTTSASTAAVGTSTTGGSTSAEVSSSSTTDAAPVCEHLDIVILTDVSLSMANFADGMLNLLLALGARIEDTFGGVSSFNLALAYNAPPIVNQDAYQVPPDGDGCVQLGALVRGTDSCVEDIDGRPFLNETDDFGAGLACLASGLANGQWSAEYETPRSLDSFLAILEADDPALSVCNAGFHASSDPLLVIFVVDAEDQSELSAGSAVAAAVATQGSSLSNVGVFVIGADASGCPDDQPNECGAFPSCKLKEFTDRGLTNVGLGDNVRGLDICRVLETDSAAVADDLIMDLSSVVANLCRD